MTIGIRLILTLIGGGVVGTIGFNVLGKPWDIVGLVLGLIIVGWVVFGHLTKTLGSSPSFPPLDNPWEHREMSRGE